MTFNLLDGSSEDNDPLAAHVDSQQDVPNECPDVASSSLQSSAVDFEPNTAQQSSPDQHISEVNEDTQNSLETNPDLEDVHNSNVSDISENKNMSRFARAVGQTKLQLKAAREGRLPRNYPEYEGLYGNDLDNVRHRPSQFYTGYPDQPDVRGNNPTLLLPTNNSLTHPQFGSVYNEGQQSSNFLHHNNNPSSLVNYSLNGNAGSQSPAYPWFQNARPSVSRPIKLENYSEYDQQEEWHDNGVDNNQYAAEHSGHSGLHVNYGYTDQERAWARENREFDDEDVAKAHVEQDGYVNEFSDREAVDRFKYGQRLRKNGVNLFLPVTRTDKYVAVKRLYLAITNTEGTIDEEHATGNKDPEALSYFKKGRYDRKQIQVRCWDLMEKIVDRTLSGSLRTSYEVITPKKQQHTLELPTFADRLLKTCESLNRSKNLCKRLFDGEFINKLVDDPEGQLAGTESNKRINANKGRHIAAGRKALGIVSRKDAKRTHHHGEASDNETDEVQQVTPTPSRHTRGNRVTITSSPSEAYAVTPTRPASTRRVNLQLVHRDGMEDHSLSADGPRQHGSPMNGSIHGLALAHMTGTPTLRNGRVVRTGSTAQRNQTVPTSHSQSMQLYQEIDGPIGGNWASQEMFLNAPVAHGFSTSSIPHLSGTDFSLRRTLNQDASHHSQAASQPFLSRPLLETAGIGSMDHSADALANFSTLPPFAPQPFTHGSEHGLDDGSEANHDDDGLSRKRRRTN